MKVIESSLYAQVESHVETDLGHLYFFKNFIISEFNEGVEVNFNSFETVRFLTEKHFQNQPYGFISNRVNSYAIKLTDAPLFLKTCHAMKAYAVVTYNEFTEGVLKLEKHFFNFNRENFYSVENAVSWVESSLQINQKQVN
ncbi:hypothetical protein [Siansivirga zeaxanthinifaciens]|uniref:STAS/SEC14 domain-containing protein n=1 Tax=Siansivirga zeaxanthinifaciens CC-SAMT-1 TaxID=1454006 RepID=A0A0C5W0U2_9FLAO|nr:hypothetical protein [Siansivirga zeaxanthinifaciens]AJR04961.1 hypothetical protein AW14_12645 [Siansivirga zeaxanthinifaciens CC-SAMT-1]